MAFDVTLTRKTLSTSQVRGFFDADFRPSHVIIIRPRQMAADHTHAISRPEAQRRAVHFSTLGPTSRDR